jgi:hypothetical protein
MMDFDEGPNVALECPNKKHQYKSWGMFFIPNDCDTWPKCPVCKKGLKTSRRKTKPEKPKKKKYSKPHYLDAFRKRCLTVPDPCPCCGESRPAFWDPKKEEWFGLDTGHREAFKLGVACYTCKLRNWVEYAEYLPRKFRKKGMNYREGMKLYDQHLLNIAIKRWNRRTK